MNKERKLAAWDDWR